MKRKSDEAIIAKTSCTSMYTSFLPSVKYFPEAKQTKIPWLAKMTMYIHVSTSKAYFGSQINQTPKIVIVFKYTLLVQKIELPC